MAQSTLQIPETLDKRTVIALLRYNHRKLRHWEMLLPIPQPDFSPELEGEEGGGVLGGGGGWTGGGGGFSLDLFYSNASLEEGAVMCALVDAV